MFKTTSRQSDTALTLRWTFLVGAIPVLALTACATTQQAKQVEVTPPPVQTCVSINTLKKVVIPAVVKKGYSIVSIQGRTEQYYDPETKTWKTVTTPPIQRKEPWTKTIKPEQIIYVDENDKEVTDICELKDKQDQDTSQAESPSEATESLTKTHKAQTRPVSEDSLPPVE